MMTEDEKERLHIDWIRERFTGAIHVDDPEAKGALSDGSKKIVFDVSNGGSKMDRLMSHHGNSGNVRRTSLKGFITDCVIYLATTN